MCWMIAAASASLLLTAGFGWSAETRELYRIRMVNAEYGPVEVSADGGNSYSRVGKVTRAATTSTRGYAASVYASPGTVAATAVHGIRIKTAGARGCSRGDSRIISIVPLEFAVTPKGFGGHVAGSSGICTDIPTAEAICRNLAPFVGNRVFREINGKLIPLADGYVPAPGDVLVIVVTVPARYPSEIILENWVGGNVEVVYPDRKETIARVQRPVRGVGRFDATSYTGVGRINTNHTGVLTISTAPIADSEKGRASQETRGGFMIQPSRHARTSSEVPQILVVAPMSKGDPWLEGMPPLFSSYVGLSYDPSDEENSFRVDVRTFGSRWTPLPAIVGRHDDALKKMPNGAGPVGYIRVRFPALSAKWVQAELARWSQKYLESCRAKARESGTLVTASRLTFRIDTAGLEGIYFVNLYVDDQFRGASNTPPYAFSLDTQALSVGEHVAEFRAVDARGVVLRQVRQVFFVQRGEAGADEISGIR